MIRFPKQIEDFVWRNYLIHLYEKCWREYLNVAGNPATYIKTGILKEKIMDMQSQFEDVFTQEDSTPYDPSALDRGLRDRLSLQQMEQENEFATVAREETIKNLGTPQHINKEIAEFLINSKIMGYAKKSLQELGVEIVQTELGALVFVDKGTNILIYKTSEE